MPNWCSNEIQIYGSNKDIKAFKELVYLDEDNIFSFKKIKPMPKEYEEDWYNWSVNNWGTKWDACAVDLLQDGEDNLEYYLETAWSPPERIVETIRAKFPELSINWFYKEPGCQIAGWL